MSHIPRVLAIDAGGTMCDTFLIDDKGDFVVGKAQTTPEDESQGFLQSFRDALQFWDLIPEQAFPTIVSGVYSGTAMINRLLSREGSRVALLVTAGMEDYLALERGVQTYLGYSYSDRLHIATHVHNPPLVSREMIRGIPERIDLFGETVIPVYEADSKKAINELLDREPDALCICLLHSYRNPAHEMSVGFWVAELMAEREIEIPVFLSSELYPIRGDFPRLNTLLVEAYAAEPSRKQIQKIREKTKEMGTPFDLRIMASHGGTISTEAKELARTLISGPIGGVVGARHLGRLLSLDNLVCADIGGTSFDLALVTAGEFNIKPNPDIARFVLCLPLVQVDSIGAGTGSYVRINPTNDRVEIGPDSAAARIGICYPEGRVDTPTITDCHVVLGHIDPDYFLGGDVRLDRDLALSALEEQIAKPLGLDVYQAAQGIVDLLEDNLRNQLSATIVGKGYAPVNYTLLCYGGGGPVHVGGFTQDLDFEDILIPTWAAGFSAYGCGCADFEYRADISIDLPLDSDISEDEKIGIVDLIDGQAAFLQGRLIEEFEKTGIDEDLIQYSLYVRMQYKGQLNDLEVKSRKPVLDGIEDLDVLVEDFETLYGKVYALAAKSPELGYLLTTVVVAGRVEVEKPLLPTRKLSGKVPPGEAKKSGRRVYWRGEWIEAEIFEMDRLEPGNVILGLAIIEAPSTTLVVPPGRFVVLDEHMIFHMKKQ